MGHGANVPNVYVVCCCQRMAKKYVLGLRKKLVCRGVGGLMKSQAIKLSAYRKRAGNISRDPLGRPRIAGLID